MVVNLLIGLPGDRPGGLALTVLYFFAAGAGALVAGFAYAAAGATLPRASLVLQAGSALLRGIPLLLLVFLMAHVPGLSKGGAGLAALLLYSFSHVGETFRSFLASYPSCLVEQARLVGMGPVGDWLTLRLPWALWRALAALATHWVSLLKDTGALVVLGIGELTTVAKILSEGSAGYEQWRTVLLWAAAMYLGATLLLVQGVQHAIGRFGRAIRSEESHA
jgi:ABC-type amino acid transport system permease subunit